MAEGTSEDFCGCSVLFVGLATFAGGTLADLLSMIVGVAAFRIVVEAFADEEDSADAIRCVAGELLAFCVAKVGAGGRGFSVLRLAGAEGAIGAVRTVGNSLPLALAAASARCRAFFSIEEAC